MSRSSSSDQHHWSASWGLQYLNNTVSFHSRRYVPFVLVPWLFSLFSLSRVTLPLSSFCHNALSSFCFSLSHDALQCFAFVLCLVMFCRSLSASLSAFPVPPSSQFTPLLQRKQQNLSLCWCHLLLHGISSYFLVLFSLLCAAFSMPLSLPDLLSFPSPIRTNQLSH